MYFFVRRKPANKIYAHIYLSNLFSLGYVLLCQIILT